MLSRSQAEDALRELVSELNEQRCRAVIYVVGGAALMLGFDARQSTHDVDAMVTPRTPVLLVAAEIAERRNLPEDWLSTAAATFVPPYSEDPNPTIFLQEGGVRVEIASAERLLAMKIHASRGRQDIDDIRLLLRLTGTETVAQAIAIFERSYQEDEIKPRAVRILHELLD